MVEPLRPARGGFLRPFGCGWFIREFLLGHGPNGSLRIDPNEGAPQADIFYHYKTSLIQAIAMDRATRDEDALSTLLEYNKEDVLNLKILKEMLL